jgi:hypothetical protein
LRKRRPDLDDALEKQVCQAAEIALHRASGHADDCRAERQDEAEEDRDEAAPEEDPVADAPEEAAEPDLDEEEEDRPLVEPDTEDGEDLVDEPALDPVDDELLPRTTADAPYEGISTLRLLTIAVGALSAILLIAGFVLPRWWSASGSAR